MNLSYNHGRNEKGHCVFPLSSVVPDSQPRQSACWAGMWQRTLLPNFIAGSGSLAAALTLFSYFSESYLIPGAQNSKKVFMVLIQQCCSWSEWLYFECSAIPGKNWCNLYDQCIFSTPSLDWYNCGSRLWEMESTSNITILDPLSTHTSSSFLAGCTSLFQLFIRVLSSSNFVEKDLQTSRGISVKKLIAVDVHTCLSEWNPLRKLE